MQTLRSTHEFPWRGGLLPPPGRVENASGRSITFYGLVGPEIQSWSKRHGFTFLELLVVGAVLFFLATLSLTCLTNTNPASKITQCQGNVKRLLVAWSMYAQDNEDRLVLSSQTGSHVGWVSGWLDWTTSSDNTNRAMLLDRKYALMGPYLVAPADQFKCPADHYVSLAQRQRGWTERARSYSISLGLGGTNSSTFPVLPPPYRYISKLGEFHYPGTAETWVFVEEHPDSINDSSFSLPDQTELWDVPAAHHSGAASFSFADGHAELHRWTACLASPQIRQAYAGTKGYLNGSISGQARDADIQWLSFHSQRLSTNSY